MSDLNFYDRRAPEKSGDIWTRRFTAWGSMAVTFAIFLLLAYAMVVTSWLEDKQAFNGMNEIIKGMAMIAVGFWLGNSNSGQKKDDALAASATKKDEALAATAIEQNKTIAATASALATSVPAAPLTVSQTIDAGPPASATATATSDPTAPPAATATTSAPAPKP